jgi:predicted Zn-dependent peptidase
MEELHALIKDLLKYRHTITYTGSLPLEKVRAVLNKDRQVAEPLKETPAYKFLKVAAPAGSRVLLFDKEMAQSQVRIEFGNGEYSESPQPVVQLFNDYFSGGMSGIVFQELREARALAYSAYAVYSNGGRKGEQNVMTGGIGCQTDKTPEALDAFIGLLENLPASGERFEETKKSIISRYRTGKLGFREVLGAVRSWERLELPIDPRKARFEKVQDLNLDAVIAFQKEHLKGRPKLISIVGDKRKFDLERLKKAGALSELGLKDIFIF